MIKRIGLIFLTLFLAAPAHAEDYIVPTWADLVRTLVRFDALSLSDDKLVDEYAMIAECDLYKTFYRDDFKWNKVRGAIRDSIRMHIATFPVSYRYETRIQLDHYDFHDKIYRFTPETTIHNVNTFVLYRVEGPACDNAYVKYIPSHFRGVLDSPLYFEGLPLAQKDAEALLQQMKDDKNENRVVSAWFNLRVIYVEPLRQGQLSGEERRYSQSNSLDPTMVRLDVHLDSIDFYEDEAMTKLIYHYQP